MAKNNGTNEKEVLDAYLHINNGGVSFVVVDVKGYGPRLDIKASHFGHQTNGMQLDVTPMVLRNLGELFN